MELKYPSKSLTAGLGSVAVITLCLAFVYGPEYREYVQKIAAPSSPELGVEFAVVEPTADKDAPELLVETEESTAYRSRDVDVVPSLKDQKKSLEGQGVAVDDLADSEARTGEIFSKLLERAKTAPAKPAAGSGRPDMNAPLEQFGSVADEAPAPHDVIGGKKGDISSAIRTEQTRSTAVGSSALLKRKNNELVTAPGNRGVVVPQPNGLRQQQSADTFRYQPQYQEPNRERYHEVTENAPVLTSTEPMSTFSIDVDTGSYTNARRFLQQGQFPPSQSVRIEEFINYFNYNYPTQSKQPFAANFEVAPTLDGDGRHLLKIGIAAKQSGFDGTEKPWNLVFLVDVSGSMSTPNKLPLVQRSLQLLANKMRPGDRISLVTYAGSSGLVLPPTGVEEKERILNAIQNLRSGGSTHGSAGIMQAYNTAERAFLKDGVNRVILATDGDFNVGITNRSQLISLIEQKRRSGITLTTLGFGTGNYNEAMMEQLANKGNGNYFYIDSFRESRKIFEEDLFGTLEVVAKDVKLQIEFNPEHVAQYRLVGYENRKLRNQDFANDKIDAGEIGAGHTVTAMYEIILTGSEAAKQIAPEYRYKKPKAAKKAATDFSGELAFLKIRYKAPEGTKSKLLSFPLKRSSVKDSVEEASTDFRFAAAVSAFAHKLRSSQYTPELTFDEIASIASAAKGEDTHGHRREFVELVKNAAAASGGRH